MAGGPFSTVGNARRSRSHRQRERLVGQMLGALLGAAQVGRPALSATVPGVTAGRGGEFEVIARIQQRLRPAGAVGAAAPGGRRRRSVLRRRRRRAGVPGRPAAVGHRPRRRRRALRPLAGFTGRHGVEGDLGQRQRHRRHGGRPLHVVAGVSAPPTTDLDDIADGMAEACAAYGIALVGGDLTGRRASSSPSPSRAPATAGRRCSAAGPATATLIWVSGPLGASSAGLRLLHDLTRALPDAGGAPRAAMPTEAQTGLTGPQTGPTEAQTGPTEAQTGLTRRRRASSRRIGGPSPVSQPGWRRPAPAPPP